MGNRHVFAAGCGSPPLPHLQGFPQMICLGEGVGQSIHGGGNNQDESRGETFANMDNIGSIIQGDNSAGDCFVLRDSIPMKFFK